LTSFIFPETPIAQVNVQNVNVAARRSGYYSSRTNEYATIKFDLDADLSTLFNWNTKQLFVYITATYPGKTYPKNEAVIWDLIIPSKSDSILSLKNTRSKYNIHDITGEFNLRNATLEFFWNVQPHVGVLMWGGGDGYANGGVVGSKKFWFPEVGARAGSGSEGGSY